MELEEDWKGDRQSRNPCPSHAMCILPKRYMVAVMSLLGFANIYAMRVNLSVAIAVMVANHTVLRDGQEVEEPAEFNWSTELQGLTLSAFYFGYLLTHLPGAILARKFGGATILGVAVGCSALLTVFTPMAARAHVGVLIALRIVIGLAEGVVYPAGHAFWSVWAPPLERTKLATLNPTGSRLGVIISMFLSAHIAFLFGWPSIFYIFGASGILWSVVWLALVRNYPYQQPWISSEELQYIESSLAHDVQLKDAAIPWKAILTSLPFWAIFIANFSDDWGKYTMLSELPLYFSQRLHLGLKKIAIAAALPYVLLTVVIPLGGQLADYFRKNHLKTGTVRKLFTVSGVISPAVFLIAADHTTNQQLAVMFFTLGVGASGLAMSGYFVNQLDIAPPYASILNAITNAAGASSGIITPALTGVIVQHHELKEFSLNPQSAAEWRTVFFVASALYIFGAIFYVLFASGEKQLWAEENDYKQLSTVDSSGAS